MKRERKEEVFDAVGIEIDCTGEDVVLNKEEPILLYEQSKKQA